MTKSTHMIHSGQRFLVSAAFMLAVSSAALFAGPALGQVSAPADEEARVPLTPAELEELAGPIALYPDDLVSIVLPASTYPLQIVQAARYLEAYEDDSDLEPDQDWDDSVVALLNYPEVIELMNEDLDWTWALGEAALYQQAELLDAIQDFRDRAYAAGNLQTDERQVVSRDGDETIVIKPADPEVIYVPYYDPRHVIVHQPYPVYHYYPRAYPVYYYPYSYGHSFFGSGFFWGVTTAFSIGWHSHYVNVHHHRHYAHPYYGHYYHYPRYRRHSVSVSYGGNIWRPGHYSGARQRHAVAVNQTNRTLGASSSSRGRMRNQPALRGDEGRRLRNQPGRRAQQDGARARVNDRTATVTREGVNRARNAASANRTANRRQGTLTRTQPAAPPTVSRQNSTSRQNGQRLGQRQRAATPRGSSRVVAPSADSRTRLRNQPGNRAQRTLGGTAARQRSQAASRQGAVAPRNGVVRPGTAQRGSFGGVGGRQRTQVAPRAGSRAPRGAAVRPGTVQRGSFGGTASRAGSSFGGRVNRGVSSPRAGSGGRAGAVNRSGGNASSRGASGGRTRNQR